MLTFKRSIFQIHYYIVLSVVFLAAPLHGEGFVAGTLVKTSEGYTPIEKLQVGDKVICYDLEASCVERPVTRVIKNYADDLIVVRVNGESFYLAPDHKLYLSNEQQWVEAQSAQPGYVLLRHCTEEVRIEQIGVLQQSAEVYDIIVADYHNFCVTQQDIHVHNFGLEVLAVWTIGAGIEWTFGISLLGLGAKLFYDATHERPMRSKLEFDSDAFGQRLQDANINYAQNNNGGGGNNNGNWPPEDSRPPRGPEDPDPNNKNKRSPEKPPQKSNGRNTHFEKRTSQELKKSADSIKEQLEFHESKLDAYSKNPGANDNLGTLRNKPEYADQIKAGRQQKLQKEINGYKDDLNVIKNILKLRGEG